MLAATGPDLLAVDDPLVAVLHGLGLQAGEVGAGAGLAEELAPRLLAVGDLGQEALLLLVGAVGDDRRGGQHRAEAPRRAERPGLADLGADGVGLGTGQASARVLLGPARHRPAGVSQALPPVGDREVGVPVVVQPGADLGPHVFGHSHGPSLRTVYAVARTDAPSEHACRPSPRGLDEIDLTDPDAYVDRVPHEQFATLRREAPVFWHEDVEGGFWCVTRHADIVTVNRDWETYSSYKGAVFLWTPADLEMSRMMMLNMDPPEHAKLRKLVNRGFTPGASGSCRRSWPGGRRRSSTRSSTGRPATWSRPWPPSCRCRRSPSSSVCPRRTATWSSSGATP